MSRDDPALVPQKRAQRLVCHNKVEIKNWDKDAWAIRKSLFSDAQAMKYWTKALENDDQYETGDQKVEIHHELELTNPKHVPVKHMEPAEN